MTKRIQKGTEHIHLWQQHARPKKKKNVNRALKYCREDNSQTEFNFMVATIDDMYMYNVCLYTVETSKTVQISDETHVCE